MRQVLSMIDNQLLLDWIMSSDFKAFGSAFAMSERGISRNTYSTKNNNKAPIELYCSPKIFRNMYSKIANPNKAMPRIDVHIMIIFKFFICDASSPFHGWIFFRK